MTKEDEMMILASRCAPTIEAVKLAGLEPAAKRLMKKGKLRRGTGAYSPVWTCPNEAKKALAKCKTKKARRDIENVLIKEIALGHDRSRSIAQVMLGTYNGKSNELGYYA